MIISAVTAFCKKTAVKFKESHVGTAIDKINEWFRKRWNTSVIVNFLEKDCKGKAIGAVEKVVFAPFTFLEFVQRKIGTALGEKIENSAICEAARDYIHNFMAINTRFWGVMLFCASGIYNILKFSGSGFINKYVAVIMGISVLMMCFNMNIMGFLDGSKVVDFVKACAGVQNVKFDFYSEERMHGAFRLVSALIMGIATGAAMFMSPILGVMIPFAMFGVLLVLQYPVCGVYAAVFLAPLIAFSSLPLAGICVLTLVSLVIKSVYTQGFKWRREGVGVAIILFLAVMLISSLFSFARISSLTVWAMYFIFVNFYFAVINTIDTKEKLWGLLRLFVISGALVALYGVMQYAFGWTTSNAWIDEEMFENETMRVYSTLANPNVLGEYLLLVLPVALVFFLKDKAKSLSKWVYLAISAVMFLCLILTQSRGCWLGFIVTVAVFVTFYEGRWWALVPLALCIVPFVMPQTFMDRLLSIGDMNDSSTSYRVFIWMGTMGILRNYLLGGIGMGEGAFSEVYPLFSYNAVIAPHAHNTFLQILVEGGLVALVVFIAIMAAFFRSTHRTHKMRHKKSKCSAMVLGISAGVAGFLFQSMFDYTFYNYRVMAVFFMVIAIAVAFEYASGSGEKIKVGGEEK